MRCSDIWKEQTFHLERHAASMLPISMQMHTCTDTHAPTYVGAHARTRARTHTHTQVPGALSHTHTHGTPPETVVIMHSGDISIFHVIEAMGLSAGWNYNYLLPGLTYCPLSIV